MGGGWLCSDRHNHAIARWKDGKITEERTSIVKRFLSHIYVNETIDALLLVLVGRCCFNVFISCPSRQMFPGK